MIGTLDRIEIPIEEHGETELPRELVLADGMIDLYEDVQSRFEIGYSKKERRLFIRAGRWIGYVPLNDKYALRINTRVPVSNLEQIIGRSSYMKLEMLGKYMQNYGESHDKPQSLYDVLTDNFLNALDAIWKEGLAKSYKRQDFQSSMPFGRIDPFRTTMNFIIKRQPVAHFSAFYRSVDFGPNQLIKDALIELSRTYQSLDSENRHQSNRLLRIRDAMLHLSEVNSSVRPPLERSQVHDFVNHVTQSRPSYVLSVRLAELISEGLSISIRDTVGDIKLPVLLVDMSKIFESYVRETLKRYRDSFGNYVVLDGNRSDREGAKSLLFNRLDVSEDNPATTPDIVVRDQSDIHLVIDVKYKPPKSIPDRGDINQLICYGTRFECDRVMVVYPSPSEDGIINRSVGMIGSTQVYRAALDVNSADLEASEKQFAQAVFECL